MSFYEELKGVDEERLGASFDMVIAEGESGDLLRPPSGDFLSLIRAGQRAIEYFEKRAQEVESEATTLAEKGRGLSSEKLARSIGRIEGMGAGFLYAFQTLMSYAEAEHLEQKTHLGDNTD